MTQGVRIRPAESGDADGIRDIRRDAILALIPEYDRARVERWADAAPPERAAEVIANHRVWVAASGSTLTGWVEVRGATIQSLYVRPSAARGGVGATLLAHAERHIRAAGASVCDLEASPNAEPFYARRGYRRAGEVEPNGGIPMNKQLDSVD